MNILYKILLYTQILFFKSNNVAESWGQVQFVYGILEQPYCLFSKVLFYLLYLKNP